MTVKSSNTRRPALAVGLAAALLLATACGGGSQVSQFHASRVISLGDESSLLVDRNNDANGSKYAVNATVSTTDPTLVCGNNPLWVQSVASVYGLVFPQCNPNQVVSPVSRIRATFGARAADLAAQIDAQNADSPLGAGDLVTVMVGVNDVIAEYQKYPAVSEPQLIANVEAEGAEAGRQVNRITDTGAKVLLSTILDLSVSPFGLAEQTSHADTDRAALISRLTVRYNASMRATIVNDGRKIGLILLDELVSAIAKFPGLNGFTDAIDPACDLSQSQLTPPSVLDCTTLTLLPNASSANLWADDRHLSGSAQALFGSAAASRAANNPF